MSLDPRSFQVVRGSFFPPLMAANMSAIQNEFFRLTDHPDYKPPDFSHNWPVIAGIALETPALDHWEWKTGHVLTRRQEWVRHPDLDYVGVTLDSWRKHDDTVVDVKAIGSWRTIDDARSYYAAQMVAQRACTRAKAAALLIVHGGSEPVEYECTWPPEYERQVWERVEWFWQRVKTNQPPVPIPEVKAPVPPVKTVDMTGNNRWAHEANSWLRTKAAAASFQAASRLLKEMVEEDVKIAHGHGIQITRNRIGSLTIREE